MTGKTLFAKFLESERSGGYILICSTVISLLLANSTIAQQYLAFWHLNVFSRSLEFWINDGLMSLFFLLVGLEIKEELLDGHLADRKAAMLPLLAALGGMLFPAAIHFFFNYNTAAQAGYGIPMATDIAFSLAILSLLGKRVPPSLKIFLTALAIIDDLGAIVVIALFYTTGFSLLYSLAALLVFVLLLLMNRLGATRIWLYLLPGCLLWYLVYRSGIHPTVAGVLLAFTIPFTKGRENDAAGLTRGYLQRPVALLILPLFALANTCIALPSGWHESMQTANSTGIIAGLFIGKPLGIFACSVLGAAAGICTLPQGISRLQLFACACLAGIGFTMSVFITLLAFDEPVLIASSKMAVIAGSLLSALAGYFLLKLTLGKSTRSFAQGANKF